MAQLNREVLKLAGRVNASNRTKLLSHGKVAHLLVMNTEAVTMRHEYSN
jgi:hypothetical protein